MDTPHLAALVAGTALLGLTLLTRSPRSARYWGGTETQERMVVVGLPCLAVVLIGVGLRGVLPDGLRAAVAVLVVLACLVEVGWGAFTLPLPGWAVPRHLRARREARRTTEAARRRGRKEARRG